MMIFFLLTVLITVFVELRYIIQTPTTHLIKGDDIVSYKIKEKNKIKELMYFLLFLCGLFISITQKLSMNLTIPLLLCIYGITGMIQYTIPRIIQSVIKKNSIDGEMIVVLKNYIFLIMQMKTLILLCIMMNLMMSLMIYYHMDHQIYMVDFLFIYIISNLILSYIIYQRFNIRRLDGKKNYKKLYTLGYDMKTIQKYAKKEISLFYLTIIIGISIYVLILSGVNIIKGVIPISSMLISMGYIIPIVIMWITTVFKERREILQWKKS